MSRSGADLALLLLGGFRTLVDGAMVELAARGYDDFRPTHEFAMRAIAVASVRFVIRDATGSRPSSRR